MTPKVIMLFRDVDMDTAVFENAYYRATINKRALPNVAVQVEALRSGLVDLVVLPPDSTESALCVMAQGDSLNIKGLVDTTTLSQYVDVLKTVALSANNLEYALRNYYNVLKQLGGDIL